MGKGYRVRWEQEGHTDRVQHSHKGLKARMCALDLMSPFCQRGEGEIQSGICPRAQLVKGRRG